MKLHHASALEQAALELTWTALSLDRALERTQDPTIRLLRDDVLALRTRVAARHSIARDELREIVAEHGAERFLGSLEQWPGEKDPTFRPACICSRPCAHHAPELRAYYQEWGRRYCRPDYDPFAHLPCKCEPCPAHQHDHE